MVCCNKLTRITFHRKNMQKLAHSHIYSKHIIYIFNSNSNSNNNNKKSTEWIVSKTCLTNWIFIVNKKKCGKCKIEINACHKINCFTRVEKIYWMRFFLLLFLDYIDRLIVFSIVFFFFFQFNKQWYYEFNGLLLLNSRTFQ